MHSVGHIKKQQAQQIVRLNDYGTQKMCCSQTAAI